MCGDLATISPTILNNNNIVQKHIEFHPSGNIILFNNIFFSSLTSWRIYSQIPKLDMILCLQLAGVRRVHPPEPPRRRRGQVLAVHADQQGPWIFRVKTMKGWNPCMFTGKGEILLVLLSLLLLVFDSEDQWYIEDPFDLKHNLAGKCSPHARKRILERMR